MTDAPAEPTIGGLTCERCGGPLPDLSGELAAMARRAGGVTLVHAEGSCIGDKPKQPEGRYFEVRTTIVEITMSDAEAPEGTDPFAVPPTVEAEEMFSFVSGVRAPDLSAAMRPLANALGEKWLEAEKHAGIADPRTGGVHQ